MIVENKSIFEGLYKPLNDVDSYLERIGYSGSSEPTEECLKTLVRCHLISVPFENLDIYYRRIIPSLETEKLFNKIVINKRGGYCFELNGLFMKLLEAIGFSGFGTIARIVTGCNFPMPYTHRVNFVDIGNDRYFCDVGYGGPGPKEPIKIVYDTLIKTEDGAKFCFLKQGDETVLKAELNGKMSPIMIFSFNKCDLCDFVPLNTFCACSDYEPFIHKLILWKMTESGKCTIDDNILRIKENGILTEKELKTSEDVKEALKQWFAIDFKIM